MNHPSRFLIGLKALRQLGLNQLGLYGLYQLGLRTGHYRRTLTTVLTRLKTFTYPSYFAFHPVLPMPDREQLLNLLGDQIGMLTQQADEIVHGKVQLFGGQPVPLQLNLNQPLHDWTDYELGRQGINQQDIKFIWEPGRFGWACTLAMAYYLSKNEQYAQAFWDYTEGFITSNPPYFGPHWSSAQEVAIRLIALTFSYQIFAQSSHSTTQRKAQLAHEIAIHAERIPPTMVYARSQNNNHLITEALGLYTASAVLPQHPLALRWHRQGLRWLLYSFSNQIEVDGTYIQHSTNYHRLMLQAALWFISVRNYSFQHELIPPEVLERLAASVDWLRSLIDPETGYVPNLGHNDGAYMLPLSICPYDDYRPVIYAACQAFLNLTILPDGPWQDMNLWLSSSSTSHKNEDIPKKWQKPTPKENPSTQPPYTLRNPRHASWAMLRAATFHSRPAHADQLHLDLWWRGLNLSQDPGTYLYNGAPPWDNSLTSALVHNTVTIDGQEFMFHAGRFLYLDWAQADVIAHQSLLENKEISLTAQHDGYQTFGVIHTRKVAVTQDGNWEVSDHLTGSSNKTHSFRLHWLLPDWEYEIQQAPVEKDFANVQLRIQSPYGWVSLEIGRIVPASSAKPAQTAQIQLFRAGELIYGTGEINPIYGWYSPTYGEKIPALACIYSITQSLPLELTSLWVLPHET
jgi:hypothetical protein